jgi:hypothetical protein
MLDVHAALLWSVRAVVRVRIVLSTHQQLDMMSTQETDDACGGRLLRTLSSHTATHHTAKPDVQSHYACICSMAGTGVQAKEMAGLQQHARGILRLQAGACIACRLKTRNGKAERTAAIAAKAS